jgi:hypothetical protein
MQCIDKGRIEAEYLYHTVSMHGKAENFERRKRKSLHYRVTRDNVICLTSHKDDGNTRSLALQGGVNCASVQSRRER